MKLDKVLKHFKTNISGLAALAGYKQPTVSNWRARGYIPEAGQRRLAELSNGTLKVNLKGLPVRGSRTN